SGDLLLCAQRLFVEDNREGIVLQGSFFCLALTERQLANAVDGRLLTLDAVELERPAKIKCGTMLLAADGAGFARPRFRGLSSESGLHDLAFPDGDSRLTKTSFRGGQVWHVYDDPAQIGAVQLIKSGADKALLYRTLEGLNGKMCELLHTSLVVQKMQRGQKT